MTRDSLDASREKRLAERRNRSGLRVNISFCLVDCKEISANLGTFDRATPWPTMQRRRYAEAMTASEYEYDVIVVGAGTPARKQPWPRRGWGLKPPCSPPIATPSAR